MDADRAAHLEQRHRPRRKAGIELLGRHGRDQEAGTQQALQSGRVARREGAELANGLVAVLAGPDRLFVAREP